jgi:hypothetical protein
MRHGQRWALFLALLWTYLGTGLAFGGEWALPDSRLGVRTAPLLLLSRPDVQAELRLEPAQVAAAMKTINELTERAATLKGKTGASVIAERRAIDEAQVDWLSNYLTGNQLIRLRQIELQWEGAAAMLSRPTVAEYLKLNSEQRQALVQMISERNAQRMRGLPTKDQKTFNHMAKEVLSSTQKELWENLTGTPFEIKLSNVASRSRDDAARQAGHSEPGR